MKGIIEIRPGDAHEHRHEYRYADTRKDRDARDRESGRLLLERLRYKWWVKRGTLGSFLQTVGDWARHNSGEIVGWLALAYLLYVLAVTR